MHGAAFLGEDVVSRFGLRFPLLVKLLDCADWLSVQVHPNDEQAERLVGAGQYGKTEAWHFLDVEEGTSILVGVKPGTTAAALAAAIRTGRILDVAQRLEVLPGETYLIPAGTLHALGPGLLLYEVQQASDTTYRVYDWDRPAGTGRQLHVEESVAVTNPEKTPVRTPPPVLQGTSVARAAQCPFFVLDALQIADAPFTGNTEGRTLGVFTVTAGDRQTDVRPTETVAARPPMKQLSSRDSLGLRASGRGRTGGVLPGDIPAGRRCSSLR